MGRAEMWSCIGLSVRLATYYSIFDTATTAGQLVEQKQSSDRILLPCMRYHLLSDRVRMMCHSLFG